MTKEDWEQKIRDEYRKVYPSNDPAWGLINDIIKQAKEHFNNSVTRAKHERVKLDYKEEISKLKAENRRLKKQIHRNVDVIQKEINQICQNNRRLSWFCEYLNEEPGKVKAVFLTIRNEEHQKFRKLVEELPCPSCGRRDFCSGWKLYKKKHFTSILTPQNKVDEGAGNVQEVCRGGIGKPQGRAKKEEGER